MRVGSLLNAVDRTVVLVDVRGLLLLIAGSLLLHVRGLGHDQLLLLLLLLLILLVLIAKLCNG